MPTSRRSNSQPGESPQVSRVLRSRAQAQHAYDRLSRWYDLLAASSEGPFAEECLTMLALRAGERVLEIGCGTGRGLVHVARQAGPTGLACGLDLSGGMLRVAQRRMRGAPGASGGLLQGDAIHLPFPAASFDAALMAFTLELFDAPEIPVVLAGLRRVLRRGGRLGVAALAAREPPNLAVRLYAWFHAHLPAVDCRPIPVERTLLDAGFEVARSQERFMWGLPVTLIVAQQPA